MEITGAVALVTGGTRGIGRAIVDELFAQGATKVYAAARHPAEAWDPRVETVELDVTDPEQVLRAAHLARDVSILVNNAGLQAGTRLLTGSLDGMRAEFETNVLGVLSMTRAFLPALTAHAPSAVVNLHSLASWMSLGNGYSVSKAAVWSLSNGLRPRLARSGVTVLGVHVGYVETDMTAGLDVPKVSAAEVGRATVQGLRDDAEEVLVDEVTRKVKAALTGDPSGILRAGDGG